MTKSNNKDSVLDLRAHFGFSTIPFTREIPIKDRWHSEIFDQPLTALRQTIEQRMSAVLLAPSGTGKTLLLRTLRAQLPQARFRVHYVKLTSLSKKDLCREIGLAAGFDLSGIYPVVFRMLQQYLRQFDEDGLRPVLILDETQDMSPPVLTTLRILTNFDMDSRLVCSVSSLPAITSSVICSSLRRSSPFEGEWLTSPPYGCFPEPRPETTCNTASALPVPEHSSLTLRPWMPCSKSPAAISEPSTNWLVNPLNWPHKKPSTPSTLPWWPKRDLTC